MTPQNEACASQNDTHTPQILFVRKTLEINIVILLYSTRLAFAVLSLLSLRIGREVTEFIGERQTQGSSAELELRLLIEGIVPCLGSSLPGVQQITHRQRGREFLLEERFFQSKIDVIVIQCLTLCGSPRGTIVAGELHLDRFRQEEIGGKLSRPTEITSVMNGHLPADDTLSWGNRTHIEETALQCVVIEIDVIGKGRNLKLILQDELQTARMRRRQVGAGIPHHIIRDPTILLNQVLRELVIEGSHEGCLLHVLDIAELRGIGDFRIQVRITEVDVRRVGDIDARIEPIAARTADTTGVAQLQLVILRKRIGEEGAREEVAVRLLIVVVPCRIEVPRDVGQFTPQTQLHTEPFLFMAIREIGGIDILPQLEIIVQLRLLCPSVLPEWQDLGSNLVALGTEGGLHTGLDLIVIIDLLHVITLDPQRMVMTVRVLELHVIRRAEILQQRVDGRVIVRPLLIFLVVHVLVRQEADGRGPFVVLGEYMLIIERDVTHHPQPVCGGQS